MIHLIEAGQSYKVYGLKGELIIALNPSYKKHILKTAVVFFMVEGNAVPFFIESVREKDELMIKFKEVNSPEDARLLSNQTVFIDDKNVTVEIIKKQEEEPLHSLVNYQLEDMNSGIKGIIRSIEEYPSQLMALVEIEAKEYMIPIHEDWLTEIDPDIKRIRVNLPDGIFDL